MKILTSVLKDSEIQNYIQENQDSSFEYLKNTFNIENIYNYIIENVNRFVVENDINSSYNKIKNFSKNYVLTILNEGNDLQVVKDIAGKIVDELMDKGILKHDSADVALAKVTDFLLDRSNSYLFNYLSYLEISKIPKFIDTLKYHHDPYDYLGFLENSRKSGLQTLAKILDDENLLNDGKHVKRVLGQWINDGKWFVEDGVVGKFSKILGDSWDTVVHAVSSTSKGKLLIGATASVVTLLGGAAFWFKLSLSEETEAVSVGTSIVDSLKNGDFAVAVKKAYDKIGNLNTTELESTSYFKSFVSFCDSAFKKLSSTSSDLWDRAKELASEHPYASVAILIFSAIGIASAYSKKGSSGVGLSTTGSNNRLVTKAPVKTFSRK